MISLVSLNIKVENHLPLQVIREKLYCFNTGKVSKEVLGHLESMRFDPAYTNPKEFSGMDFIRACTSNDFSIHFDLYTQNYFAWKFVPVNAHVPSYKPNLVLFNTRQLGKYFAPWKWERTCWHELIHAVDSFIGNAIFWHGDNDLNGKDETAPVKLANFLARTELFFGEEGEISLCLK